MIKLKKLLERKATKKEMVALLPKVLSDMKKVKHSDKDYEAGMKSAIELFEKTFHNITVNTFDDAMKKYTTELYDMRKGAKEKNIAEWSALDDAKNILERYFTFGMYY